MFRKKQIEEANENFGRISFLSLTKKYWKEQLFFYLITTLSCIGGLFIDRNTDKIIQEGKREFFLLPFFSRTKYIATALLFGLLYFLIVYFHVWYALHLESKIRRYLKKLVVEKMFRLAQFRDKQAVSSLLNYGIKVFSENVFYIPNQLYYVILEVILSFVDQLLIQKKAFNANRPNVVLFSLYLPFFILACVVFQSLLYYLETNYYNSIDKEMKNEIFLIENHDLIIKKDESSNFFNDYDQSLNNIFSKSVNRNLSATLSFVFPSHFLVKIFPFLCAYFSDDLKNSRSSIVSLARIFGNIRKLIERGRDFPFYYSSQKKINEFLAGKERDDKQNGQIIDDYIQNVEFKDIAFTYNNEGFRKEILSGFNVFFGVGKVNQMNFPNGFGKSTIINLLVGMLKPQSGEVLINGNCNLGDVDINWWRSVISYSEHRNLILRSDLSTGQKQLIDLSSAFENQKKQVFIFDEADSNLDRKNRNEFLDKLRELSKKKLVILVSHHLV